VRGVIYAHCFAGDPALKILGVLAEVVKQPRRLRRTRRVGNGSGIPGAPPHGAQVFGKELPIGTTRVVRRVRKEWRMICNVDKFLLDFAWNGCGSPGNNDLVYKET
jgi:hypothetical protein